MFPIIEKQTSLFLQILQIGSVLHLKEKGLMWKKQKSRSLCKMETERKKFSNDLDYDPFDSIDLIKMEDEVRPDQVPIKWNETTCKLLF